MRAFRGLCVALVALAGSVSAAGAATWIVPAVFDGPGANGVLFSTDLTLVNPDATGRTVTVLPILGPSGVVADPLAFTLAPGESRRIANPVSGVGALRISSEGGVFVAARANSVFPTAGPLPPATRATPLPVTDVMTILHAGETGQAIWISQSSDPTHGERTNVGVVFPEGSGGTVVVTVFGPPGTVLGTTTLDSPRAAALQMPLATFAASDIPVGRLSIEVTRGSALAYAGSVDNATGDLAVVGAERLPAPRIPGATLDLVSSGVAQTIGKGGVVWHTDARLANGFSPAYITAYLRTADGQPVPPATLRLDPEQMVEIRDVVQSLFNVSTAVTGSILWRSTRRIFVGIRTRAGESGTTSASSISSAVPIDNFPGPSDAPGQLADLRTDAEFRTNVQAASGAAGAVFDVDLFDQAGNPVASARETLPPLSWAQWPLDQIVAGAPMPARTRARVRIASGTALASANVVDNRTGDPVPWQVPLGAATASGSPPVPVGTWGAAPNGMDHVTVDANGISVFLPCRTGNFPQPLSLDASGRFAVIGTWLVTQGPTVAYDAILTGQSDGHSLTFTVTAGTAFDIITAPETVLLGGAWGPFTGLCPIEY